MTEANYLGIDPREDTPSATSRFFSFYRLRDSAADTRFLPGCGTRLHFASKSVDTLECVGVPSGFLLNGDKVKVQYKGATVFLGRVETRTESKGRGVDETENVVCTGPWADMSRLVYRQQWYTGTGYTFSSRLVLNQDRSGSAQNLNAELLEIAQHGAQPCGYTAPQSVNVSGQYLPFDECRDVTVADAIRRELRFFPKTIVRFDYSTDPPTLVFARPGSGADATYVASVPKTARQREYTAHPITGVDLEIETVGDGYRAISHQTAGDTAAGNPDCLYATLQLAGATGSTVTQSLDVVTENLPSSLNDATWWKDKHPRLKNVSVNQITISDGARSGEATKAQYPRIVANSAGELESAGINCRAEQFSCTCKINDGYDSEEEIALTMNFLMTNATTKKYSWVVSSESSAGETVPAGLAAAILADRSGVLKKEKMILRLGDALPVLGDRCDGLFLQSFDVDCRTLLADLAFGTPDYLSPEDMAALLSGFRNKCRPSTSFSRSTGKPADDNKGKVEAGSIPPLSSTEWAPGKTTKKTIHAPAGSNAGSIELNSANVPAGKKVEVKSLTVGGSTYKIMGTEDINVDSVNLSDLNGLKVVTGIEYNINGDYKIHAHRSTLAVANGAVSVTPDPNDQEISTTTLSSVLS